MRRFALLLLCLPLVMVTSQSWADVATDAEDKAMLANWTRKYDHYFQKYSKRYFGPGFDWTWFKAQAIAESRLNPAARSHVGAKGIMQIMPSTYVEIREANPGFGEIHHTKWNIAAGIYYDHYLYQRWDDYQDSTRLNLTFASYNAGLRGMRGALRKAGRQVETWPHIEPHTPAETRHYVRRIQHVKRRELAMQHNAKGINKLFQRPAR